MRRLLLALPLLVACPGAVPEPTPTPEPVVPVLDAGARAALHRLTGPEWRNATELLTGVRFEGALPNDLVLHGYSSVGAAEVAVAPLELEQYEAAAWAVADAAVPDAAAVDALLGCPTTPPLGREDLAAESAGCVRAFGADLLRRAWRRPPDGEELDHWAGLYEQGGPVLGVRAMIAGALLAPDFLFRVEPGEATEDPQRRRLPPRQLAHRLAFALTDAPASDELVALLEAEGDLGAAVDLLLADGDEAAQRFFAEWLALDRLELVAKNPEQHPEWGPALVADLRAETAALFASIALDEDIDLRQLFLTRRADLGPDAAALYGVEAGTVTLPAERAGLLTRGAFLATYAHADATSPTNRGKFVRARLLCRDVPPPPPGVVASLDALPEGGTLRDRLEQHANDPACSGCHNQTDPIGFAFEHFDAVGAWRDLDNGLPVDASAQLGVASVDGGAELGAALAEDSRLPPCVAANAWAHLLGRLQQHDEGPALAATTDAFVGGGHRWSTLVRAVLANDAFAEVRAPEADACPLALEGTTRPCDTACGEGREVCTEGAWSGCDAPPVAAEVCNGVDDDCDGAADDRVVEHCTDGDRPGLRSCTDGVWGDCDPAPQWEVCNGVDDDGDGQADEGLAADVPVVSSADLVASHESCDPAAPHSQHCRAAAHRRCGALGCAASGWGPVASEGDRHALACLDSTLVTVREVSFYDLAAQHGSCTNTAGFGPDCNAAISRWCGAQGLGTGYGPVERSADVAFVACTPTAQVQQLVYSDLAEHVAGCNGDGQRMGALCDEAIHRRCRADGFATGFGPLENWYDDVWIACVGAP